ncbi:hypothetical protein INR49_021568 [Caranx melampygus]|nr:hypothetical protein INR49_021568 [Caranx melampygus]
MYKSKAFTFFEGPTLKKDLVLEMGHSLLEPGWAKSGERGLDVQSTSQSLILRCPLMDRGEFPQEAQMSRPA